MESAWAPDSKDRRERIAEAAYLRAERRGFRGGDPVADWIAAEREVDAMLRRDEHHNLLEQLESRLSTAGTKLKSLKKKVSGLTADARKEVEQDVQKLAKLRDNLEKRFEEIREQGEGASHKAKEQAEKLWGELSELMARVGSRKAKNQK